MKHHDHIQNAKVWLPADLPGVEMLAAHHLKQNFGLHFHRRYAVGVVTHGAMEFQYLKRTFVAASGQINLSQPGESHDGHAVGQEGWRYRMFYLEPTLLEQAVMEVADRPAPLPNFTSGVIEDPGLASGFLSLHFDLEENSLSAIEQESRLTALLARLVLRHSDPRPREARQGDSHRSVALAREYLEENYGQNPTLSDLSRAANLSRFHLLRLFKEQMGLPPHAYLNQVRVSRARLKIAQGQPLSQTALSTGFVDQSHMNRVFKNITGFTPGQYRKAIQENQVQRSQN